jgi:hypothetical protein
MRLLATRWHSSLVSRGTALCATAVIQNEELALAVDQLRRRRADLPWLIPVRFDDSAIPDLEIGAGRTLASLQRADVFGADRDEAIGRLVRSVMRIFGADQAIPRESGSLSQSEASRPPVHGSDAGEPRDRAVQFASDPAAEANEGDELEQPAGSSGAASREVSRLPFAGSVRVRDAEPRLLGVHASIYVDGAAGNLPAYVPRDIDARLREVLSAGAGRGCFVLIVGGSSVGKTRTLHEAVCQVMPDWHLVHPDASDRDAIRGLVAGRPARTVFWLDELQRYLGVRGLTAGTVRQLLQSGQVVAATMWPEEYGFRVVPREAGGIDMHASDRELLELATVFDLSGEFTAAELSRARRLAVADERLRVAMRADDGGLTQLLAAGPQLVRRWDQAPVYAKAVITAAIDARRLGVSHALPGKLLADAVPGYLTAAQRAAAEDEWLAHALTYGTTPCTAQRPR